MDKKYAVKNIKTFKAHEGMQGFTCTLYKDGEPIAEVFNDQHGGEFEYTWASAPSRGWGQDMDELTEYCKTLPPHVDKNYPDLPPLDICPDMFVEDLVLTELEKKHNQKVYKKFQKELSFKLPTHGKGEYAAFKMLPNIENKMKVLQKYGKDVTFLDEHPEDWMQIANAPEREPDNG